MIPYCILAIEDDSDRAFMTSLYNSYGRLIYHQIFRIVADTWAAEDLMQEVLIKLIERVKELRAKEERQLVNYIIAVAQNKAKNYIRDTKAHREVPLEENINAPLRAEHPENIDMRLIAECDMTSLAQAWPHLSERSRYLLEGRYILEKSVGQLAEELNLKPGSVRMALTRARKEAYQVLQNEIDPQI